MTELSSLVVPIALSTVFVFIASSIIHMASPWHKSDYPRVPNEDRAREVLRALAIPPGDYMIPRPSSRADLRSPEFAAKIHTGPVMILTVMPNGSRLARSTSRCSVLRAPLRSSATWSRYGRCRSGTTDRGRRH